MVGLPLRISPTLKTLEPNDRITTISSTAVRIPNYGKTLMSSTAAGTYIMEAPIPGVRKVIVQTTTSTVVRTINGPTTTVLFANTTATNTALAFDTLGDMIELEGRTSLIWDVISNTAVTLS